MQLADWYAKIQILIMNKVYLYLKTQLFKTSKQPQWLNLILKGKERSQVIPAFSIGKDSRMNGKISYYVQDCQICGSGTDEMCGMGKIMNIATDTMDLRYPEASGIVFKVPLTGHFPYETLLNTPPPNGINFSSGITQHFVFW